MERNNSSNNQKNSRKITLKVNGKAKNLPSHTYSIARNFIMKMCRILKKLSKKETEMDHNQREETKNARDTNVTIKDWKQKRTRL